MTDKTKEQMVETTFYAGTKLISSQKGTYSSANSAQQVTTSVWRHDPELSLIRTSNKNAVGDKYMIYQCGMFRKLNDVVSSTQLKVGDEFDWIFGYRQYKSRGSSEL